MAAVWVVVGFVVLQLGMWAVVTGELARTVGWVSLVSGGYLVDRAWRALLNPGQTPSCPSCTVSAMPADLKGRVRWAGANLPWVPVAAVVVGWLLARLRGTA